MAKSLRIAIADDEPAVRQHFAAALEKLGHEIVVAAADGRELLEACSRERPELLVTDIRMDKLTGIEAMQELMKQGPIPTILISAHYRPSDFDGELNGQVVSFLRKPIKVGDLTAAVTAAAEELS